MTAPTIDLEPVLANGHARCQGRTKAGTQCRKAAQLGKPCCLQHEEQDTAPIELPVTRAEEVSPERAAWLATRAKAKPVGRREKVWGQKHSAKGAARTARRRALLAKRGFGGKSAQR